ncbi:MAG: hypothetical protein ACE5QW_02625 [Thermoplasmata archaeon]
MAWNDVYSEVDAKVVEAKECLESFFAEHPDDVFYMKQLQVYFEKEFFHWVTANAIYELLSEGKLGTVDEPLLDSTHLKFVFNRKHRYFKRQVKMKAAVVRKYSDYYVARACGQRAENLFLIGIGKRGFLLRGQHVNSHQGREWQETKHNLDFILERDGVSYGCEVKNTFSYINKKELEVKLQMCKHLRLRPLFIMRHSPKTYNWEIRKRKGIFLIFETRIYPLGLENLVQEIRDVLRLPVDCPRYIPEGIIDRFENVHNASLRK